MLTSTLRTVLGFLFVVTLCAPLLAAPTVKVERLRCEYKTNPIGIDVAKPRLSWQLAPVDPASRGLKQTAWQVIVASSLEKLQADTGDLWDSGRTASDQSVNVEYAGKTLTSAQDCFWKVRVWDQNNQPSDWSAPGVWTMGLLRPVDWQAQWIGCDDLTSEDEHTRQMQQQLSFTDSSWIWTGGAQAGNQPAGQACFRKVIQVPTDRKLSQATALIAADDAFNLFVNAHTAGSGTSWKTPANLDITAQMTAGTNVVAIQVTNGGDSPSPAGLMGKVIVAFESGDPLVVPIDASWRSTREPGEKWTAKDYDDTKWTDCSVVARHGDAPWGELQVQSRPDAAGVVPAQRVLDRQAAAQRDTLRIGAGRV